MHKKQYEALIIGAGLGGLTTASTLAMNGKKVLVVEAHDKVGGYATNFKRGYFIFDASLHNLGPLYENKVLYKIFKELDILKYIKFLPFNEFQRVIFPNHDFVIPKGVDKYICFLKDTFPQEKDGINALFNIMISIKKEFDEIEDLEGGIDKIEEIYPMLAVKFPMLTKLAEKVFGELLDEYIHNDKLKSILGSMWYIYSILPDITASIPYSLSTLNYYNYSGGIIQGTSQKLSDSLAFKIKECNGDILLNTEVKKIVIESKKVKGIITKNNEYFHSDIVISNSSPYETFCELIDRNELNNEYRERIQNLDLSLSGLQLYMGLNCDLECFGIKDHNITVFETYDHNKNYEWILNGNYEKAFYTCTNYTMYDKTLAPVGKSVLCMFGLDHIKNWEGLIQEEYREKKQKVLNIMIGKLEKIYPKLSNYIEVVELATPLTMKRYTRKPEGTIYGSSTIIKQAGLNRLKTETPIKHLYLVGADIYPGAGFSSVISSAYKTARMILDVL